MPETTVTWSVGTGINGYGGPIHGPHASQQQTQLQVRDRGPLLVCCSNLSMKTITCQDRLRTHTQHQEMSRDKRRGFTSRAGERREHGRHRPVLGGRAAPLLHHWQRILTHCTVLAVTTPTEGRGGGYGAGSRAQELHVNVRPKDVLGGLRGLATFGRVPTLIKWYWAGHTDHLGGLHCFGYVRLAPSSITHRVSGRRLREVARLDLQESNHRIFAR